MKSSCLKILIIALAAFPAHAIEPYSTATVATINGGAFAGAASVTNPSGRRFDGSSIGYGAVGTNGNSRFFKQIAAFRVSDLLAELGTNDLADLSRYTFAYQAVAEENPTVLDENSIYHAAYIGQWEDTGTPAKDVPLRGTTSNENLQNMGDTPSANSNSRTLFCDAADALTGYTGFGGSGSPKQVVNLGDADLASRQVLQGNGFDLSGLATELAADDDLSNNYVFFSIYLDPDVSTGSGVKNQAFESVSLIPSPSTSVDLTLIATADEANGLTLVFNRPADSIGEDSLFIEWGPDLNPFANVLTIGTTNVEPSGNAPTIVIDAPSVGQITVNIPAANAEGGKLFARLRATLP